MSKIDWSFDKNLSGSNILWSKLDNSQTSVKDSVEQFSEHDFEDIFGNAIKNESDEVK